MLILAGPLLFIHTPFVAELSNSAMIAHVGRGMYFGVSHAPFQDSGVSGLPVLGFSCIYACTL